jgi:hypothetical protein
MNYVKGNHNNQLYQKIYYNKLVYLSPALYNELSFNQRNLDVYNLRKQKILTIFSVLTFKVNSAFYEDSAKANSPNGSYIIKLSLSTFLF